MYRISYMLDKTWSRTEYAYMPTSLYIYIYIKIYIYITCSQVNDRVEQIRSST